MNPHTHDFRDTVRPGEKTGSAFQAFPRRSAPPSPWLIVSTVLAVVVLGLMMVFLPESPPW